MGIGKPPPVRYIDRQAFVLPLGARVGQQRVCVEPTACMDDEQERRCLVVLAQRAQRGKTLVIVTHKPSLLPLVSRIVVMSGNSIIMDGARDQVIQELQTRHAQASAETSKPSSLVVAV